MKTILLVEDDINLAFVIKDNLELAGYKVIAASDGLQADTTLRSGGFDLVLLDVNLPKIDGFTLAEDFRRMNQKVPILFLTARNQKEDRLQGFKIGGDDYISKPFSIEELLLRIEVFLRRSVDNPSHKTGIYKIGNLSFDFANLSLLGDNLQHKLTQKEADILLFLVKHQNQIVKRADLLLSVWGKDDYFLGRSLDVFISRLRKYLVIDPKIEIENVHGIGFRLKL